MYSPLKSSCKANVPVFSLSSIDAPYSSLYISIMQNESFLDWISGASIPSTDAHMHDQLCQMTTGYSCLEKSLKGENYGPG